LINLIDHLLYLIASEIVNYEVLLLHVNIPVMHSIQFTKQTSLCIDVIVTLCTERQCMWLSLC